MGEPLRHAPAVYAASLSADGARIWDVDTGQPVGEPLRFEAAVHSASFSPDGARVVTASVDNMVRIWDKSTGQRIGG
jgi:WD40 repeat protein